MRTVVVAATLGLIAVIVAISLSLGRDDRPPDRRYRPIGWGSEATLEIREDGETGLLFSPGIRFVEPPTGVERVDAYRLDWTSLELTPTTRDAWARASGQTTPCERAGLAPGSALGVVNGELRIAGAEVPTRGHVRHARLSADGRMAAVLSATGITMPSLAPIPALAGGNIAGWRYHQFVAIPSGERVGPPVALGLGISDPAPCWSPNGRAVIYADSGFTNLSLVLAPR